MEQIDYKLIAHYLAVVEVGTGMGSYAVSKESALKAINDVVRIAKADWKIKGEGYVHVYDVTHSDSWTHQDPPRDVDTKKPLPYLYSVKIKI